MSQQFKIKKFISTTGCEILVGQDDASNDYLTLKLAEQNDIWLHVSGFPGSHVVLKCAEPDKQTLLEAARLAAWHSKMKSGGKVAVSYCLAKNVSKPRGAKSGSVVIRKEKKVSVKPMLLEESEL
ncbi:MAG: NFACT RNA binding domain-containing protein [bacterium]